ncbi:MAG: hypothetical protein ABSC53_15565, partial [Bacteroidota bacterium]
MIILPPNGLALSPDSIFDRIQDPVQRDCGADKFRNTLNRRSPITVIPLCGISISIAHSLYFQ